ncbi:MAG: hypothetical protein JWR74_2256 [Polaromonas sp.]|jgi:hypothetical protein|nr:hypothetical protein [Polaromonas sp.]
MISTRLWPGLAMMLCAGSTLAQPEGRQLEPTRAGWLSRESPGPVPALVPVLAVAATRIQTLKVNVTVNALEKLPALSVFWPAGILPYTVSTELPFNAPREMMLPVEPSPQMVE